METNLLGTKNTTVINTHSECYYTEWFNTVWRRW